jgi:hypothetical protein
LLPFRAAVESIQTPAISSGLLKALKDKVDDYVVNGGDYSVKAEAEHSALAAAMTTITGTTGFGDNAATSRVTTYSTSAGTTKNQTPTNPSTANAGTFITTARTALDHTNDLTSVKSQLNTASGAYVAPSVSLKLLQLVQSPY